MASVREEAIKLADQCLVEYPTIKTGCFMNNDASCVIHKSQINLPTKSRILFHQQLHLSSSTWTLPVPMDSALLYSQPSECGKYVLRVQNHKANYQLLEIWQTNRRLHQISLKEHAKVLLDGWFQSLQWDVERQIVFFIGEPKQPDRKDIWENAESSDSTEATELLPSKYEFQESWGEKCTGIYLPSLFRCNFTTGTVDRIQNIPKDIAVGQFALSPDKRTGLFVGWPTLPRKYGVYGCTNRPSFLYSITLSCEDDVLNQVHQLKLHDEHQAARSPRFSSDGLSVAFLASGRSNAHDSCAALCSLNWETKEYRVLVDFVRVPDLSSEAFPGLYTSLLPLRPWVSDNKYLILGSIWGVNQVVLKVNIEAKAVERLTLLEENSYSILDVGQQHVLVSKSSPSAFPTAQVLDLHGKIVVEEPVLELSPKIARLTKEMTYEIIDIQFDDQLPLKQILLLPQSKQFGQSAPFPLHVVVHGGPHVCFTTEFSRKSLYYLAQGQAILLVNYRGSTGYGQASLESIFGKIGDQDIADVMTVVNTVTSMECIDSEKLSISGGSHGGFILSHVLAKHPTVFKAALIRNPNVDAVVGSISTDIPDWYVTESGHSFNPEQLHSYANLQDLQELSALSLAHQVRTPVLLGIGLGDKRVHPLTSRQWYYIVRQTTTPIQLLEYPEDGHALDSVAATIDFAINGALWLHKYVLNID